jgi:hypothetical protein
MIMTSPLGASAAAEKPARARHARVEALRARVS